MALQATFKMSNIVRVLVLQPISDDVILIMFPLLFWNIVVMTRVLLPIISNVCTLYFYWCLSRSVQKQLCYPTLRMSNLGKDDLSKYRPIPKLLRNLLQEWSNNVLLNIYQTPFYRNYSILTSYFINALSHQQVTCLNLLDWSATIDHILLFSNVSLSS